MSDDSDDFFLDGEEETGPLDDSGNGSEPADLTVPDPYARSRRFEFKGKIGNFSVNREIGRGGMGVVYEATEAILNRRVALKILPPEALIDEMQIRRFRNEAAAAAQLLHPNIVPVYSVGSDRGVHFYAMQLINGQNIAQVIGNIRERLSSAEKLKNSGDTPVAIGTTKWTGRSLVPDVKVSKESSSLKQLMEDDFAAAVSNHRHHGSCQRLFKSIATIGCDAARAIHHAHDAGVIHRDIKPSNLMLDDKGKVWITDFGLAQIRDNPVGTGTGDLLGTLKYMSPEQASGRKFLIDHRTDIYSLGVTLYELLTLKPALSGVGAKEIIRQVSFEDPLTLRQINPRIPAELETIILKAIAKNPQERYNTAGEFADDLERFCTDQPIAARRPSAAQKLRRWIIKNQAISGMIGVGMVFTFLASLGITAATLRSNTMINDARNRAIDLLSKSEGWRLLTHSRAVLQRNPGLAIALAREGSKRTGGLEANMVMHDAIAANHELRLLAPRKEPTFRLSLANRSQKLISVVGPGLFGNGSYPALVLGLKPNDDPIILDSNNAITSAAFSPTEQLVLTASCGIRSYKENFGQGENRVNAAVLWELPTGRRRKTFADHMIREVSEQMFSPDGAALVLPGPGNEATVYSSDSTSRKLALREHVTPVVHAAYSRSGELIATSDTTGLILLWNANDGKLRKRIAPSDARNITHLQFSFDSQLILAATDKGTWSYSTLEHASEPGFWQEPAFEMSPSQNRCACYTPKGARVNIREMASGASICEITGLDAIANSEQSIHTAFTGNSQRVVVASGTTMRVHDAISGKMLYELLGHTAPITNVKYNKGNETIISASVDGSIRIWSESSGRDRQKMDSITDGRGNLQVHFSSDSRYVLSGSTIEARTQMFDIDGKFINGAVSGQIASKIHFDQQIAIKNGSTVSLIEPATSRVIATRTFNDSVDECVPLNNGQAFILTFDMSPPMFWNTISDVLSLLIDKGDSLTSHAVSQDSSRFLIGTANGRIQVHESSTGKKSRTIYQPSIITDVDFMPGSTRLASIDDRARLRIWGDSDELAEMTIFEKEHNFTRVLISPDSKFIITYHEGSAESVCCWDTGTGKLLRKIAGSKLMKAVLHPSKPIVYLGSRQEGLKAWNFETDQLSVLTTNAVNSLALLRDRVLTVELQTNVKADDMMQEPQPSRSSIRAYSTDTEKVTAEITSSEGALKSSLSLNHAMNQIAVSVTVYSVLTAERNLSHTAVQQGGHTAPISFSSFIGKSNQVVTASWDGKVKIWGENNQLLRSFGVAGRSVTCGAISVDGKLLACGNADGTIVIWDTDSGEESVTLKASDTAILSLAFDRTGLNLVATDKSKSIRNWNLVSHRAKEVVADNSPSSVIISPDSKSIVVFAHNGETAGNSSPLSTSNAQIVSLSSERTEFLPQTSGTRAGALSDSGKQLGFVLNDGSAVIFELSSEVVTLKNVIKGNSESYINLAFSPADVLVALLSEKGVAIWDLAKNEQVHFLPRTEGSSILCGKPSNFSAWTPFSPDGLWLGLASTKGTDVFPVTPLQTIDDFSRRFLSENERELFHVGLTDSVNVHSD